TAVRFDHGPNVHVQDDGGAGLIDAAGHVATPRTVRDVEATVPIFTDRKSIGGPCKWERFEPLLHQPGRALLGANPDDACSILNRPRDDVRRQSIYGRKAAKLPVFQATEPTGSCAEPERTVARVKNVRDHLAGQPKAFREPGEDAVS